MVGCFLVHVNRLQQAGVLPVARSCVYGPIAGSTESLFSDIWLGGKIDRGEKQGYANPTGRDVGAFGGQETPGARSVSSPGEALWCIPPCVSVWSGSCGQRMT